MQIKNIILGIAIIILTSFVTIYGMSMFFPNVEYDDYCGEFINSKLIDNQQDCVDIGGKWTSTEAKCISEPCAQGYCDNEYTCRQEYDKANKVRSKNIFIFSIPLGILVIALGAFLFNLEAVGAGLMGGGAVTLIYGAGNYWQYGENWFRFTISLIGLIAVIGITYWLNKKFDKKRR